MANIHVQCTYSSYRSHRQMYVTVTAVHLISLASSLVALWIKTARAHSLTHTPTHIHTHMYIHMYLLLLYTLHGLLLYRFTYGAIGKRYKRTTSEWPLSENLPNWSSGVRKETKAAVDRRRVLPAMDRSKSSIAFICFLAPDFLSSRGTCRSTAAWRHITIHIRITLFLESQSSSPNNLTIHPQAVLYHTVYGWILRL